MRLSTNPLINHQPNMRVKKTVRQRMLRHMDIAQNTIIDTTLTHMFTMTRIEVRIFTSTMASGGFPFPCPVLSTWNHHMYRLSWTLMSLTAIMINTKQNIRLEK